MPVLLCWPEAGESDKLWLAAPHLRMCDRWAVNLQKRYIHQGCWLFQQLFLSLEDLPRPGRRHDKQEL